MIALADLIERFESALLDRYALRLLPSQHQALAAMKRCRTRFAPRMLAQCTACGEQRSVPHSCGHRACPHCQHHEGQVWLQRQLKSLVPATYFMVTFTLPAELRGLALGHQRVMYALVMQCAWDTLNTFSHNDAKLGAGTTVTAGAVGVLHTHNRRLDFHPHVHMVMPAAALDAKQKLWRTKVRPTRSRRGKTGNAAAGREVRTAGRPAPSNEVVVGMGSISDSRLSAMTRHPRKSATRLSTKKRPTPNLAACPGHPLDAVPCSSSPLRRETTGPKAASL